MRGHIFSLVVVAAACCLTACGENGSGRDCGEDVITAPGVGGPEETKGGPGDTTCLSLFQSSTNSIDGCFTGAGRCSDGRSYQVYCEAGGCLCLVDSELESDYTDVRGCPSTHEAMADVCGWDFGSGDGSGGRVDGGP